MKRFASALAVTTILMSTLSITPATAAPSSAPAAVESSVAITAPAAALTFERVEVKTAAAPVKVLPAPSPKALKPVAKPVKKIKAKAVPAPVKEPAPIAPAIDPYSGNPIVDCAAQGLIRAEDYSCVAPTFYAPETGTDAPFTFPPCDNEDDQVLVKGVPVPACHWDAQKQGNGTGTSFTKYAGDGTRIVYTK